MTNNFLETPALSAFLTNVLSLEGQNTTTISVLKCKTVESGKNCIICCPHIHLHEEDIRIKASLGATAKGVAEVFSNLHPIRERD